jgi:fatty acid desaturase
LRDADARLVERHPWLSRDDVVAMGLFIVSVATIGLCIAGWFTGLLPTVLTILAIALAGSVLHEMEHDLIHDLYFSHPAVRIPVLTTIWVVKASIDPWTRGRWHRWHHKVSGQDEDIEERLIGLGLPWGPLRVLITLLPPFALILKPRIRRAIEKRVAAGGGRPDLRMPRGFWMVSLATYIMASQPFVAIGGLIAGAEWAWPLMVLWVLPNTVRYAAIVVMSSNCHYTEIQRGVVMEQNQILDHPIFWPLQVLCWNFGATHIVHHFFVRQSFWRRTLIFGGVRQVMVDNGIRANDLGTFARANRRD